jgi:hypothetical protein
MNMQASLKAARTLAVAVATSGLAALFMMAASDTAEAKTHKPVAHHQQHHQKQHPKQHVQPHHKKKHHVANDQAQATPRAENSISNTFRSASDTIVFHVRSGRLEFNGHVYDAGSGNRNGYNNPNMSHVSKRGPVPAGVYSLTPREGLFHGTEAWRVLDTPGRTGILIHPASVRLRGRPFGESLGCIAVKENYEQFKRDMHRLQPSRIIVKPG